MQLTFLKITKKFFLVIFFFVLLTSCFERDPQSFIFKRNDSKTNRLVYYKTNIYTPSHVEEMDMIPCSENTRVPPIWSPDGKFYGCGAVKDQPLLIRDVHNTITARLEQGNPKDPILWEIMGWSPDSQYVSIGNTGSKEKPYHDFSIMKYDGTELHQFNKSSNAAISFGQWSPNGKYIVLQTTPYSTSKSAFLIFDMTGKEIARFELSKFIKTPIVMAEQLKWSPDSKKISFLVFYPAEVFNKLYVLDMNSKDATNIISDKNVCVMNIFDCSPDSKKILFDAIDCKNHISDNNFDKITYSINVDGSQLKPLTGKGSGSLHWTLDGKSILMDGYGKDLYLMDMDGGNKKRLVDIGDYAVFVSWIRP
jgi:Tol biopolymer transport system component